MRVAVSVLICALALSACHRAPQDLPTDENANVEAPGDIPPENTVTAMPVVNATNVAIPAPAPPKVSDDTQMHDDADATGLTSRLPDDEPVGPGSTANETRPAEK